MARATLLLTCLIAASVSMAKGQTPEASPQLGSQALTDGILQAVKESGFKPPIEITDVLKAPTSSSDYWIVCMLGSAPAGPKGWAYTVFFKEQYTHSRFSADYDGCGGHEYHAFSSPSPTPPAPPPVAKKPHRHS